ncbi:hypothetical protein A0U92_03470 [Acetobacter aceti]|uniref:Uncharacterized protein n=1 Tax=Acetobacter aceti TaxID=435 RepID=A0A1U9KDV5_ACEAC|nr:hypothetical protein [Acetobacter aceti]AQS83980.1 hypothetical protein A0U92_03470 [Acetobacter aceti]
MSSLQQTATLCNSVELLLSCRRFSTDALLIAADYCDECSRHLRTMNNSTGAAIAGSLANRLRDEAPHRIRQCA